MRHWAKTAAWRAWVDSTWWPGEPFELESHKLDAKLREWVDATHVRALLERHRAGVGDHGEMLWAVLVLSRFLERWAT